MKFVFDGPDDFMYTWMYMHLVLDGTTYLSREKGSQRCLEESDQIGDLKGSINHVIQETGEVFGDIQSKL